MTITTNDPANIPPSVDPELPQPQPPAQVESFEAAPVPVPTVQAAPIIPVTADVTTVRDPAEGYNGRVIPPVYQYLQVLANGNIVVPRTTALNFQGAGVSVNANGSNANITVTANTGNWRFSNNTFYNYNGGLINNSDQTHGATAFFYFPPNGSTDAIDLLNYYGNFSVYVGSSPGNVSNWTFDNTGNITLPTNTANINYANGVSILAGAFDMYTDANVATFLENFGSNVISTTGNITSGGATINGDLVVTGNASLSGNIVGDRIVNGSSSIEIQTPGGNANISIDGVGNVAVFSNVGIALTGDVSATGNITANTNISATGNITASGTVFGTLQAPDGNTSVLINDAGVIGAAAGFSFDKDTDTMYVPTGTFSGHPVTGVQGFYVGVPGFDILGSAVLGQLTGDIDSYSQINLQNINEGGKAAGDYIITADNGSDTTYYIDMGITGSGWDDTETNVLGGLAPNNGYLYTQDGNLTLGTRVGNTSYKWNFDTTGNLALPGNISTAANVDGGNINTSGVVRINHSAGGQGEFQFSDGVGSSFVVEVGTSGATWAGAGSLNLITSSSPGGNIGVFVAQNETARFTNTGMTVSGIANVTGNVIGNYFIGNGSQLTGLPASYTDSNVTTLLAAFGSNTISTTGNISAGNFIGDAGNVELVAGSYNWTFDSAGNLTLPGNVFTVNYANGTAVSLAGNYNDANVITLLGTLGSNNISTTGNVTTGNLIAGTAVNAVSITLSGTGTAVNASSGNILTNKVTGTQFAFLNGLYTVSLTGSGATSSYTLSLPANAGSTGQVLTTDGSGNLSWSTPAGSYGNSNVTTLLSAFGSNTISTTGNIVAGNVSIDKLLLVGDGAVFTGNTSATANVIGGTGVLSNGVVSAIGNITGNNIISNTATFSGNVTAANFIGNISITGNVTGTSANVTLVAGSYSYVFDNVGELTLPAVGGDEGGQVNLGIPATNTTLQNKVTVDVYQNKIRFFEGSANARGVFMDLSQTPTAVGGEIGYKASGFVNAGTFVTLDNIKATVTSSANYGLSLATVSGSITVNVGGNYSMSTGSPGGSALVNVTLTTSASSSLFNWNFTTEGDTSTYILTDKTNTRSYRITLMIGSGYNNNMISIERLA